MVKDPKNGWTPERRAKQAAAIKRWSPWTKSTGPKTAAGKAVCARNATKHGLRAQEALALRAVIAAHSRWLNAVLANPRTEFIEEIAAQKKNATNGLMDSAGGPFAFMRFFSPKNPRFLYGPAP